MVVSVGSRGRPTFAVVVAAEGLHRIQPINQE